MPPTADTPALLAEYARTRDPGLRDTLITRHQGLVKAVAGKFARPGVPMEDLVQTAWVALIGALDRFEPDHGNQFSTYAVVCMTGEIKRYFRDRTWAVKVPRELQDLSGRVERQREALHGKLGRSPTLTELAEATGETEETLVQAMELHSAYQPSDLDAPRPSPDGGSGSTLSEMIGGPDAAMERTVLYAPLIAAIATLDERDQRIIRRRFFDEWSQARVAEELGLSQMHVSRLERRAIGLLREAFLRLDT